MNEKKISEGSTVVLEKVQTITRGKGDPNLLGETAGRLSLSPGVFQLSYGYPNSTIVKAFLNSHIQGNKEP